MNADGSNQHQVGSESPDFAEFVPEFTPDGRHIVFARVRRDVRHLDHGRRRSNKRAITPFVHNPSNEYPVTST